MISSVAFEIIFIQSPWTIVHSLELDIWPALLIIIALAWVAITYTVRTKANLHLDILKKIRPSWLASDFISLFVHRWPIWSSDHLPNSFWSYNKPNIRLCFILVISCFYVTNISVLSAQTTITKTIASSTDDAEEEGSDGASPGAMYLTSSDIELVYDPNSSQGAQIVGLRFTNITVPQGATITDAYLTFVADAPDAGNPANTSSTTMSFRGHDIDNSTTFTPTSTNISSRVTTTASVDWTPTSWSTNNSYNSDDISTVIQEIVDRAGWNSGNALSLIVTGSSTGARTAHSFDGIQASAPQLTITYNTAPPLVVSTSVTHESCGGANDGAINVTVSGGTTPYTYLWSDGVTTEDRSNLAPGTYSVTVTAANGSKGSTSAVVNAAPGLTLSTVVTQESTPAAGDGAIDLTVGGTIVNPLSYQWEKDGVNFASSEDISGLSEGTYTVTVTDGCPSTASTSAEIINYVTKDLYLSPVISTVAVDATSNNFSANPGSTTFSVSHTTGTGDNRLMLVGISQKNQLVSGVTYAGIPLTLVGEEIANGNARVHLYSLVNPPSGVANVVVTLDANPDKGIVVGVTTYTGVDQFDPLGTFASAQSKSTTPSVGVSSASGELVYAVATMRNATFTADAPQSTLYNIVTGGEIDGGSASTKSGAEGTVTMSYTGAGDQDWAIAGVSIKRNIDQTLDRIDPVATADPTTHTTATLAASPGGMALDVTTTYSNGNPGLTTIPVSHTTGTGDNRLMLVGISQKNKVVTGVTYGGVPLSLVGEEIANGNAKMHLYSLLNPPSGTANVVVNLDANPDKGIVIGVSTFSGVDQSNPFGSFASVQGKSTSPSVGISSASDELIYAVATMRNATFTADSPQTTLYNFDTGGEINGGSASTKPGEAGTVTMSYTGAGDQDWAIGGVSIKSAPEVAVTSFTQSPVLCDDLTIVSGQTIAATNYVSIVSGTMPASPDISAELKYGATSIATLNSASYSGGILTITGTVASNVTIPVGQAITVDINSAQGGVAFNIDYDSQTKPSKVELPVTTYIDIASYGAYDAPYPGGNIVTNATAGDILYLRALVSDPFGVADINGVDINIPSIGTVNATLVNTDTGTCVRTYEYVWNTTGVSGNASVPATAKEGFEGTVTDVAPLTVAFCTPVIGDPVFSLGATSTRCQAAGTVDYDVTSVNASSISYSLDANSLNAGNTINSSSRRVRYVSGWSGISTITATAEGCGGPKITQHTVITTPTVGIPVFTGGASSIRCKGAGSEIYTANASNSTSITYSLDAASLSAGNSIVSTTGEVTFVSTWAGPSIITATATGCNGPSTSDHVVNFTSVDAIDDAAFGVVGLPVSINVAQNDECDVDLNSVTIITQPNAGNVQVGSGGYVTYIPNGAVTETFTYQICSNAPVVCDTATVTVVIEDVLGDVCFEANDNKTYYLPFPENSTQLRKALLSSASFTTNHTNNVKSIFTLSALYPGTIITFDHWEDGYESDITDPVQPTTLVWGDGIIGNGDVSAYCALCTGDNIPAGAYITTDNTFPYNPRLSANITFDGKDKIFSTNDVSISKIAGDAGGTLFSLQNVKTNVVDITRFGQLFVIPFGENMLVTDATYGLTGAFKYTSLFVRAATDSTVVNLDYNGDNIVDISSPALSEGEVWFYDGTASTPGVSSDINNANDIKAGAIITANHDVGVDLVFGGIDSYGTRNVAILPGEYYGSTYYSPVWSTNTSAPAYAFFTNTSNQSINIDWENGLGATGTVAVPAKSTRYLNLNAPSGYKFESQGGETYSAVVVNDADASASAYDWAFNLIPEKSLTRSASISWAPGSSNGLENHTPVWVTATTDNTDVYVKYDGNLTDAGIGTSPCGLPYDFTFNIDALESFKIKDPDNDQTGVLVYTCDQDKKLAVVWGEESLSTTPGGAPAQDVGYIMEPKCIDYLVLAADDLATTPPNVGVIINILDNDNAFLTTLDPSSVSTGGLLQPANGTVAINPDGTITYTPDSSFIGVDQFEYIICNTGAGDACDIAVVTVTVTDCNAKATTSIIRGYTYLELNPDNTATNDFDDVGDDDVEVGSITIDLYTDGGTIGVIDGTDAVVQTNVSSAFGLFTFTVYSAGNYIVKTNVTSGDHIESADNLHAVTAVLNNCIDDIYLGVLPVLDAIDDSSAGGVDQPQAISILDNDLGVPNPSTVSTTALLQPTDGIVTINVDGTVTYTPNPGYIGTDTFEYQVCSIEDPGLCDIALVTVEVSCDFTPGENNIFGTVFWDEDLGADFDAGEGRADAVTVNLYEDFDNNGTPDGAAIQTTTTDVNGNYDFTLNHTFETTGSFDRNIIDPCNDAQDDKDDDNKFALGQNKLVGVRFTDITIPAGATIDHAYLYFTADNNKDETGSTTVIRAHDVANPDDFCVDVDLTTLSPVTTTSTAWTLPNLWVEGTEYTSSDIKNVVQELVDSYSYSSGAMAFLVESNGSKAKEAMSYETNGSSVGAPRLYIEYTEPGDGPFYYLTEIVEPAGSDLTTSQYQPTNPDFVADGTGSCGNNFGIAQADVSITKTDNPDPVIAGSTLTYTIDITNNGLTDALGVIMTDAVPVELTGETYTLDGGSSAPWTGSLNLGTMAPDATHQIIITGTVNANTCDPISNVATVSSTYPTDPDLTNNASGAVTTDVLDIIVPMINGCPSNIVQSNDAGQCEATVTWTPPTATDNCTASGSLVWSSSASPGSVFGIGTTTVTYTVTDASGNVATCSFDVTVNLPAPPNAGIDGSLTICSGETVSTAQLLNALTGEDAGGSIVEPLAGAGIYTYVVYSTVPCAENDTSEVVVTEQAAPNAGVDGAITICPGTTITSAQLLDALTGEDVSGSFIEALAGAGTYTYVVNAAAPCAVNDTSVVVVTLESGLDSDGDGIPNTCDLDDDNDGILDVDECPASDSGIDGPLASADVSFDVTGSTTNGAVDQILNSITVNGTVYSDFFLPDSYASNFTAPDNPNDIYIINGGVSGPFYDISPDWPADAILPFQNTNLNHYHVNNASNVTGVDYIELFYDTPILITEGVFISFTERGGNNNMYIELLDNSSTVLGPQLTLNENSTDYINMGFPVAFNTSGGQQDMHIGIFPIDDFGPVGSYVSSVRIYYDDYSSGDGSDGGDGQLFVFGDLTSQVISCRDTDLDGIPDYLDLDSDNDGCPDAIEGSGTFTVTDIENDTLTGGVAATGIPNVAGVGQGVGESTNVSVVVCCDATASGYVDSDGDGVADFCDIDDDNDGIPDIIESGFISDCPTIGTAQFPEYDYTNCGLVSGGVLFTNIGTFNGTSIDMFLEDVGGAQIDCGTSGNLGCVAQDNGFTINNTDPDSIMTVSFFESGTSNPVSINWAIFLDDFDDVEGIAVDSSNLLSYTLNSNNGTIISNLGNRLNFQSEDDNEDDISFYFADVQTVSFQFTHDANTNRDICFSSVSSSTPDNPVCVLSKIIGRDTDGDGIDNHLDLDSDNDGILDVYEAGHNLLPDSSGRIINVNFNIGVNGLDDRLEAVADNGSLNYTISDSEDTPDGEYDPYELDSDDDGCFDSVEESVPDSERDGTAGTGVPLVDANGLVVSIKPYVTPANGEWQDHLLFNVCIENCFDGIDNDGDGLVDCEDPDCGLIALTNTIGTCIDHPLEDIAELTVSVSWATEFSDTLEVEVLGSSHIILMDTASSPTAVKFNVPADGTIDNIITASWGYYDKGCTQIDSFDAPIACSNDSISCNILYLCGDNKLSDADPWDHGWIDYLDDNNGSSIVDAVFTKNEPGLGTYDPNNPAVFVNIDFSNYDLIIVSASTEGAISTDLVDTLKGLSQSIILGNSDQAYAFDLSLSGRTRVWQDFLYTDDVNSEVIYNFQNDIDPFYDQNVNSINYRPNANSYLWTQAGNQSSQVNGVYVHYEKIDVLPNIGPHGPRTYFGLHMDQVYANDRNGGPIPSPQEYWFHPTKDLTTIGKIYFDQMIVEAAGQCGINCQIATMNPHIMYYRRR